MIGIRRLLRSVPAPSKPTPAALGWLALTGLLVLAALWASEPTAAHPSETSWRAGRTVSTWDWEQHWNYWKKLRCTSTIIVPGTGAPGCGKWESAGNTWKSCGSKIRPPDPTRVNSCNIGSPGGHSPHGDGITVKYQYLNKHQDRPGPKYKVCEGDESLPADTSPGNCGTWITVKHAHCPDDPSIHPPDCPSSTGNQTPPSSITDTTKGAPPTTGQSTTTTKRRTTTTRTTSPPRACKTATAINVFRSTVDGLAAPSLGFRPARNGYVRVPVQAYHQGDPSRLYTTQIGSTAVTMRIWASRISWRMTGLGRTDGTDLGVRTFHRYAPAYGDADSLKSPVEVRIGGAAAVYLRSSLRAGYPSGYPVEVEVVWSGECQESGRSGWTDLGTRNREATFSYEVFAIRSRPR